VTARRIRKGDHVQIIGGRWKGRSALVVGRTICGSISLSLLDQDWDSPIVATQAENLELQPRPEVTVRRDGSAAIWL
jgi:hypothetical protein